MEKLTGILERITFQSEDSGFSVLQLKVKNCNDTICVVGTFPSIAPGETMICEGTWKQHPSHGRQFESQKYELKAPADLMGMKKYLGSGLIKGIGPKYAEKIIQKFGMQTLDIIDQTPERLKEIPGLGEKRSEHIRLCWGEQKAIRAVMIFLQGHGVSPGFAQKLFKIYGAKCIESILEDPYRIARDIHGIGFKTADSIAKKLGVLNDAQTRIEAGIEFILRELSEEGHVCYPEPNLIANAAEILLVGAELVSLSLVRLQQADRIERFDLVVLGEKQPYVWFKPLFNAEIGIAHEIERLLKHSTSFRSFDIEKAMGWVQTKLNLSLADAQIQAVSSSLVSKFQIITGGPGTGKSTITNAILKITEQLTDKITLAAPTGRAAKRMSEITGKQAKTIHSLLEVDFKSGGFKKKRDNPLECDLLIIDEASMIDTFLMYHLLKAIPSHCRVILVGDVNQLPSVGPGNVLQDIIQSLQVPVVILNEIYRQAQGSKIIVNAHRINQGSFPEIDNKETSDFFFIKAETPEEVLNEIIKLVVLRIPAKYNFNAFRDIQVLAPMKKGIIGIENLNLVLQERLNPQEEPLFKMGRRWHLKDKVMQIRNNYQKEVFNGDIGYIQAIDLDEQVVLVIFDEREIIYDFTELDELTHAYAVSIHKFQGSECPCVVIPVHTTHFKLLHRNLLYTGVTRGKQLVVLVGTPLALSIAVKNNEVKQRHTGLKQALMGILG